MYGQSSALVNACSISRWTEKLAAPSNAFGSRIKAYLAKKPEGVTSKGLVNPDGGEPTAWPKQRQLKAGFLALACCEVSGRNSGKLFKDGLGLKQFQACTFTCSGVCRFHEELLVAVSRTLTRSDACFH